MNLELGVEESPVVFHIEELDAKLRSIHERAVQRKERDASRGRSYS
jgi:hypothetical protein